MAVLGGTPHASTEDDTYKGMFIPKGSTVIAPLWSSELIPFPELTGPLTQQNCLSFAVHLNEKDFPDPHNFKPERFLAPRDYPGTFGHSAFGWGRRICPGMHVGSNSVALNIARILWAFEIKPVKTPTGEDVDVDMYVTPWRPHGAY